MGTNTEAAAAAAPASGRRTFADRSEHRDWNFLVGAGPSSSAVRPDGRPIMQRQRRTHATNPQHLSQPYARVHACACAIPNAVRAPEARQRT
eukprot:355827-Chlamydomonas_euryale.AAC.6